MTKNHAIEAYKQYCLEINIPVKISNSSLWAIFKEIKLGQCHALAGFDVTAVGLRAFSSFNIFRANLIKIIRPIHNSAFDIFNPLGLKLITRLQLGLSHLNEHSFQRNFNDCTNPLCTCSLDSESTGHYFLHCNYYNSARISLLNDLNSVDRTLLDLSGLSLVNVLLYGGPQFDDSQNAYILNSSIKYILISERFSGHLF